MREFIHDLKTMYKNQCSGQTLTAPQDHGTCPTAPGVSQVDNELDIPDGLHSPPRREHRALPRAHIQPSGEDLGSFLSPTSATTRSLPDLHDIGSSRRFPLPRDTVLSQIIKVVMPARYLHVLNTLLFQWGRLWIVADISACQSEQ